MQRYFINHDELYIDGDDYFHIKQVMRMKIGDLIEVCIKSGCYLCEIKDISDKIYFDKKSLLDAAPKKVSITLIQGLGKSDKQEIVSKYATQFGVDKVIFVPMRRSIAKYEDKAIPKKIERFKKIALEAARLAHRPDVPEITYCQNLADIQGDFDLKLIAYESDKNQSFLNLLNKLELNQKIIIVIGPEGGIDESEIKFLTSQGYITTGLGSRILQTEIASLYALSVIDAYLEANL